MQNKMELASVSLPEKLKGLAAGNSRILWLCGAAGTSYVMSNCFLFGVVAPFGVAFVSALDAKNAVFGALGALMGYLISVNMLSNIKYIGAIALVLLSKWLFGGIMRKKPLAALSAGTCFLCLGICSGAATFLGGASLYGVMICVAEVFLGCGAAYFFARSLAVLKLGMQNAGRADISCVAIGGCIVLTGLTSVHIFNLSAGRVLGVLSILLCARYAQEAGGAIAGIAAGISVGLAGSNPGYIIGAYALGGLSGGIFGRVGRLACAGAFIVINTAVALLTMGYAEANLAIYEVFAASALFIAVPNRLVSKFKINGLSESTPPDVTFPEALRDQLGDISAALRDIGETTRSVSERLGKMEDTGMGSLCDKVAELVCAGCNMKTYCWQQQHSITMNAFNDCVAMLRKNGVISKEHAPRHFLHSCIKPDELLGELRVQFCACVSRERTQRKVAKVRAVLSDQFEGAAMILDEASAELCSSHPLDAAKTRRVRDYLLHRNIPHHRLACSEDEHGRMVVSIAAPNYQAAKISKEGVALALCDLLDADFDLPEITPREKYTTFTFCEKAAYTVELGAYQLSGGGNRFCGDAYDFIQRKNGQAHFIISDGMGSGGGAAVDSGMACGLLKKLVMVGVGYEAALKMVNSALLVKSGEESLATIDVCTIDLFTGKASFYKAGAAPTFILKGGKAGHVESASLPAGILHGVSFDKSSVTLHEGDIIVMMSDGAVATGTDWIKSELGGGMCGMDMQRLSEKLAISAKMRRTDGHEDDITVLAAALRR